MQRLLPGPIERIWAYLTESDLRRRWLAAGEMTLEVGAPFEFVWRNDELTDPPGARPDGVRRRAPDAVAHHRARPAAPARLHLGRQRRRLDRARAAGRKVLLTLIHRRLPDRADAARGQRRLARPPRRARGPARAAPRPAPFWDELGPPARRLRAPVAGLTGAGRPRVARAPSKASGLLPVAASRGPRASPRGDQPEPHDAFDNIPTGRYAFIANPKEQRHAASPIAGSSSSSAA